MSQPEGIDSLVVDQAELNEGIQLLKAGCDKFLSCRVYLRDGEAGPVVREMAITATASANPTVGRLLPLAMKMVEALGGQLVEQIGRPHDSAGIISEIGVCGAEHPEYDEQLVRLCGLPADHDGPHVWDR